MRSRKTIEQPLQHDAAESGCHHPCALHEGAVETPAEERGEPGASLSAIDVYQDVFSVLLSPRERTYLRRRRPFSSSILGGLSCLKNRVSPASDQFYDSLQQLKMDVVTDKGMADNKKRGDKGQRGEWA